MRVLLVGGGSGGHITPLLAVAESIKKRHPDARCIYIGAKGDKLSDVIKGSHLFERTHFIRAGKFRRYHGDWRQIFDVKTILKNARDLFYFIAGTFQSFWLLKNLRPDVIFIKGGFVGVPIGLSAAVLKVPYITHDSDILPGLANRIVSRWAHMHAVALPEELYTYPKNKTVQTGVPVGSAFGYVNDSLKSVYRTELGISEAKEVLCVQGGGLGAQRVNEAILDVIPNILKLRVGLFVLHLAGRDHAVKVEREYSNLLNKEDLKRVLIKDYVTDSYRYSGAADLIVCRAGATSLAEFASQSKACIVVPNPILTGGHQLKNAKALAKKEAIHIVVEEDIKRTNGDALAKAIVDLLDSPKERSALAKSLHQLSIFESANKIADMIFEVAINTKNPKSGKD